jgi:hypothetical protein
VEDGLIQSKEAQSLVLCSINAMELLTLQQEEQNRETDLVSRATFASTPLRSMGNTPSSKSSHAVSRISHPSFSFQKIKSVHSRGTLALFFRLNQQQQVYRFKNHSKDPPLHLKPVCQTPPALPSTSSLILPSKPSPSSLLFTFVPSTALRETLHSHHLQYLLILSPVSESRVRRYAFSIFRARYNPGERSGSYTCLSCSENLEEGRTWLLCGSELACLEWHCWLLEQAEGR